MYYIFFCTQRVLTKFWYEFSYLGLSGDADRFQQIHKKVQEQREEIFLPHNVGYHHTSYFSSPQRSHDTVKDTNIDPDLGYERTKALDESGNPEEINLKLLWEITPLNLSTIIRLIILIIQKVKQERDTTELERDRFQRILSKTRVLGIKNRTREAKGIPCY